MEVTDEAFPVRAPGEIVIAVDSLAVEENPFPIGRPAHPATALLQNGDTPDRAAMGTCSSLNLLNDRNGLIGNQRLMRNRQAGNQDQTR